MSEDQPQKWDAPWDEDARRRSLRFERLRAASRVVIRLRSTGYNVGQEAELTPRLVLDVLRLWFAERCLSGEELLAGEVYDALREDFKRRGRKPAVKLNEVAVLEITGAVGSRQTDREREAKEASRQVLAAVGDSPPLQDLECLANWIVAKRILGQGSQALDAVRGIENWHEESALGQVYVNLADIHLEQGDLSAAARDLERAVGAMETRGRGRGAPECAELAQTYAKLDSPAMAIKAARRCLGIVTCGLEASSVPTSGGRLGRRPSYVRALRTIIPVIKQLENRWPSAAAELEHVKREILEVRRALMEW